MAQTTIVFKISPNLKKEVIEFYQDRVVDKKPPSSVFQVKDFDCVTTLYESGKIMFQGIGADIEASYWIVFAVLGWISIIFPLICVARAFTTDSIRSVALSKGMTAFGDKSMQTTKWGKFICASKFMRISYAVAKVAAFILLIVANIPNLSVGLQYNVMQVAIVLAWIAIIFCVVRAIPVVAESGKLFEKQ